jgi:uncharacterized protein
LYFNIYIRTSKLKIITMSTFTTKVGADEQFYFNLKNNDGKILLTSEGYTTAASRDNGIESVKKNASDDSKYENLESTNGKHYFNLKAGNGQVIGKSTMYDSAADRDAIAATVKAEAADAGTEEA